MPRTIEVPSFAAVQSGTKSYNKFRGLDYSTDESQIDDSRSPRAVNIIADEGGAPERRWGWRTVHEFSDTEAVAGIFPIENDGDETNRTFLVHAVSTLYRIKLDADYAFISGSQSALLTGLKAATKYCK